MSSSTGYQNGPRIFVADCSAVCLACDNLSANRGPCPGRSGLKEKPSCHSVNRALDAAIDANLALQLRAQRHFQTPPRLGEEVLL